MRISEWFRYEKLVGKQTKEPKGITRLLRRLTEKEEHPKPQSAPGEGGAKLRQQGNNLYFACGTRHKVLSSFAFFVPNPFFFRVNWFIGIVGQDAKTKVLADECVTSVRKLVDSGDAACGVRARDSCRAPPIVRRGTRSANTH